MKKESMNLSKSKERDVGREGRKGVIVLKFQKVKEVILQERNHGPAPCFHRHTLWEIITMT